MPRKRNSRGSIKELNGHGNEERTSEFQSKSPSSFSRHYTPIPSCIQVNIEVLHWAII